MIPVPANVRIWVATGQTDMRRGMTGLALQVQEVLKRDPHAGDLYLFRGKRGDLIKRLWHDGLGLSLYAKRLDRGRFIWPVTNGGSVAITPAQMGYLLEAIAIGEIRSKPGDRQSPGRQKTSVRLQCRSAHSNTVLKADV